MQLSKSCYAVQGLYFIPPWGVNAGFVVGKSRTLIIDTGTNVSSAQTIYGYAKAVSSTNEIIVINTEKHFDHIGGNCFFREKGIDIYGHHLLKRKNDELLKSINYFNQMIGNQVRKDAHEERILLSHCEVTHPNILINQNFDFDLGGLTVNVILTPGHSDSNISLFIPEEGVLYTGDTIVNQFIPNLEDSDVDLWKIWLSSLETIEDLDPSIVVPGHGDCILTKQDIKKEVERLKKVIEKSISSGKAPTVI